MVFHSGLHFSEAKTVSLLVVFMFIYLLILVVSPAGWHGVRGTNDEFQGY